MGPSATVTVKTSGEAYETYIESNVLLSPMEVLASIVARAHDVHGFHVFLRAVPVEFGDQMLYSVSINYFPILQLDWMRTVPSASIQTVLKKMH